MTTKLTTNLLMICVALFASAMQAYSWTNNGLVGFAGYQDLGRNGVTGGGASAQIIHVSTHDQLAQALLGSKPRVIIVDADIIGKGMQDMNDELSMGSNFTLLGAGDGKALKGICLDASDQQNIIIRNITLTKGRTDGLSFRNCQHVWIDHCDLSDSYDGLLDFTLGSDYLTVSWTKLHNHNKVSITNSGTCHYEDYNKEHVTFSHCWFANNTQRNPRIGYGRMHIYNCYWTDISSYCIGFHSQAQVQSQYNYFTKTAQHPFCNQYSDVLPYRGYLSDTGSYFANGNPGTSYSHNFTAATYKPETFYSYAFDQSEVAKVPEETEDIGPKAGLALEPILCPANGAIQQSLYQQLSWGRVDGAVAYQVRMGTAKDAMTTIYDGSETTAMPSSLTPATTYYWQVTAVVNGEEHASPVYQFTTATEQPTTPYPEVGSKTAWLRWPTSRDKYCTPLPLQWRPAADAVMYKVYVGTTEADMKFVGETKGLQLVPDGYRFLPDGTNYLWRVDAVKKDGTTVKGTVWNFVPNKKTFVAGANEVHGGYVSGIAFRESVNEFTGGKGVRGDQGPGCIHAMWAGAAGKYAIETVTYDQNLGPNLIAVSINDKMVDEWMTSDEATQFSTRKSRRTVELKPGDEVRIDFVAGYVNGGLNESVAHIDQINFVPTTQDVIENARRSGIYHAPVATKGYEYENLPLSTVLFKDTLGTVGDFNGQQVKDMYASWITMEDTKFTFYLKTTARVVAVYGNGSVTSSDTIDIEKSQTHALEIARTTAKGTLQAVQLYKSLPTPTKHYAPKADAGKDYQLVMSPDYIYIDSKGEKGVAGKYQVADAYASWIKYTNPTANEVQAKKGSDGIKAFINPDTDKKVSGFVPTGKNGTTYNYCVGTEKYMTYYITNCERVKFYYSGTGGAATNLYVEATVSGDASTTQRVYGDDAAGKNVASEAVEMELDPARKYQVKVQATTGDMLIYAVKLWPGVIKGDANGDGTVSVADLALIAACILGEDTPGLNKSAADMNGDGTLSVADLASVAAIILGTN
ncbi:MAG: hypothetical protein KBT39_11450 [Bacteroidales bacterium]|nr:hypothetical protein [Bacteroidales bacterium]